MSLRFHVWRYPVLMPNRGAFSYSASECQNCATQNGSTQNCSTSERLMSRPVPRTTFRRCVEMVRCAGAHGFDYRTRGWGRVAFPPADEYGHHRSRLAVVNVGKGLAGCGTSRRRVMTRLDMPPGLVDCLDRW